MMPGVSPEFSVEELVARYICRGLLGETEGLAVGEYLLLNDSSSGFGEIYIAFVERSSGREIASIDFACREWIEAWELVLDLFDGNYHGDYGTLDLSRVRFVGEQTACRSSA